MIEWHAGKKIGSTTSDGETMCAPRTVCMQNNDSVRKLSTSGGKKNARDEPDEKNFCAAAAAAQYTSQHFDLKCI